MPSGFICIRKHFHTHTHKKKIFGFTKAIGVLTNLSVPSISTEVLGQQNSPLVILSRNTIILICVSSCCNVQFADMETFALLLGDRFWRLNRFHRYFVFLSKCKIVKLSNCRIQNKNVSYGTYGKKIHRNLSCILEF